MAQFFKKAASSSSQSTTASSDGEDGAKSCAADARMGLNPVAASSRLFCACAAKTSFLEDFVAQDVVLGTGLSGEVKQAICRSTGRHVATKTLAKANLSDKKLRQLQQEVDIHLEMDHPNIVQLDGVYETESEVTLVMEKLEGGEVFDRLLVHEKMDEKSTASIIQQTLQAIEHMHDKGCMHRDVKLENLVFSHKDGQEVKLIDFGFSTRWNGVDKVSDKCGTLHYVAPEVLAGSYSDKCDVWSVGVVAYMLLTGKSLYYGENEAVAQKIKKGKMDISRVFLALSPATQNFVRALLHTDPSKRLSAREALEHPWLADKCPRPVQQQRQQQSASQRPSAAKEHRAPAESACVPRRGFLRWPRFSPRQPDATKALAPSKQHSGGFSKIFDLVKAMRYVWFLAVKPVGMMTML
eukprot:gb/GFBE01035903.1/.p1 GENE.gb/GFBE01035903.1/~~gb/GFBE01035903.1/.p1  ORF type:complete len:410 (+),score=122.36 gb/GFBE01035903.1/:1-1230(+)